MGYFTRIGKKYNLETNAVSLVFSCEICKDGTIYSILRFKSKRETKILPSGKTMQTDFQNSLHMCKKCVQKYRLNINVNDDEEMKQGIALLKMKGKV